MTPRQHLTRIEVKSEREELANWEYAYLIIGITGLMVIPVFVALAVVLAVGFSEIL